MEKREESILDAPPDEKADPDRRGMLPGVSGDRTPPRVVFDSQRAIRRARIRAVSIDVSQLLLLVAVDILFVRYHGTHVPFATRHLSVIILVVTNVVMVAYLILARALPRWRARRIAATWSADERSKFF